MELHGMNLVCGRPSAAGKTTFRAVDPARSAALEPAFHEATGEEIARAAQGAAGAFARHRRDAARTAALLERIAQEIEALGDPLIERAAAETGLPAGRLKMERGRTVGQLRMFADLVAEGSWVDARIDRADPRRRPVPKPDVRRMLIPLGPVVVFGASNFPLAYSVAGGDTASALAAGNPVIVKGHPAHPGTSEMVGEAVRRAVEATGFPPAWFALLHGASAEAGLSLVRQAEVAAVGFTGSLRAGRALFDAAAARPRPIPVFAEMGSVNPILLLPEALAQRAEQIAEGLFQSFTLGVGQFCTKPGLVFAVEGTGFQRLRGTLEGLVRNHPPSTMLHRAIFDAFQQNVESLRRLPGVEVLRAETAGDPEKTQTAAVLILCDESTILQHRALTEENFGPAAVLVRCRTANSLAETFTALDLSGQLTAAVHGTAGELAEQEGLLALLERTAGRLIVDGFPTGVEVCPSIHHGGPYPATTDARWTSVGTAAIIRFARGVCYQGFPREQLPLELRNRNVRGIRRLVDGRWTTDDLAEEEG